MRTENKLSAQDNYFGGKEPHQSTKTGLFQQHLGKVANQLRKPLTSKLSVVLFEKAVTSKLKTEIPQKLVL